jgi:uncharacterized protein (TIRG00374 family)
VNRKPAIAAVKLIVRIGLGLGILAWLFLKMPREDLTQVLSQSISAWPWWVAGITATFLGLTMGSIRWHRVLAAQGFATPIGKVFRIFFIGQFFNAFFLGACGGDLVRAYYATLDNPGKRTAAASTVLVDRAVGLFTFIAFGCAMILLRGKLFLKHAGTRVPAILMAAFLAGSLIGMVVLFRRHLFETWPFFKRLESKTRLGGLLRRTYEVFYFYREQPHVMVPTLLLSFMNLIFLTLACYCFGRSLDVAASIMDYFTLFPIITVLAAIPITPGALGIREGLFAEMFSALGVASVRAVPLSLLAYLGGVVWSLFGAVLFMLQPPATRKALKTEVRQLRREEKAEKEVPQA